LYVKPCTYHQLWRATKIHRNTLKLRLDQLLRDNIIIKHHYAFHNYRGKYTSRDFYLLNWAKKQSKEMVGSIFDNQLPRAATYIMSPDVSRLSYEINSIHIEPSKREYTIIRPDGAYKSSVYLTSIKFSERVRELRVKERDIFEQIIFCIGRFEPFEKRNKLLDERDSIIELLILLCTRFCIQKYVAINSSLSPFDMLVFFATIRLYDYSLPYVKFWEIMERVGY
jgi:hypothetical protein